MKKAKTLFISDLDGTLLNKNAEITPVTAKIINGLIDDGLIFTYATARSFLTAAHVTGNINFKYPAVHHNGVFIQNPRTGEYYDKCSFDKDKITEIIRKAGNNSVYPLVYAIIDGGERVSWIKSKEPDGIVFYLKSRENDKRLRPVSGYDEFLEGNIHEFTFIGDSPEELLQILRILDLGPHFTYHIGEDAYKDTYGKVKYWLEIMRFDATKDTGAKKVKELVGADKIICFGDNTNDIPMFNICDEKYAVDNAIAEIKNIATAVIGSNEDDGVARWLEKYARNYA